MVTDLTDRSGRAAAWLPPASNLPSEKTLATLDRKRLSAAVAKKLRTLCERGRVMGATLAIDAEYTDDRAGLRPLRRN